MSALSASDLDLLILACEAAGEEDQARVLSDVASQICPQSIRLRVCDLVQAQAFMGAAIAMLPDGADWRKYTPGGCSLYAASPFNAAAQVRYDGHTSVDSLSLCAALLRLLHAKQAKAEAQAARRVTA